MNGHMLSSITLLSLQLFGGVFSPTGDLPCRPQAGQESDQEVSPEEVGHSAVPS